LTRPPPHGILDSNLRRVLGGWAVAMLLLAKLYVYAALDSPVSEQADADARNATASAKNPITAQSTRDDIRDQLDDLEHLIESAEERFVEQDASVVTRTLLRKAELKPPAGDGIAVPVDNATSDARESAAPAAAAAPPRR